MSNCLCAVLVSPYSYSHCRIAADKPQREKVHDTHMLQISVLHVGVHADLMKIFCYHTTWTFRHNSSTNCHKTLLDMVSIE